MSPPSYKLVRALLFLRDALAARGRLGREVFVEAAELGLSRRTIERARAIALVRCSRRGFQGPVVWHWPEPEVAARIAWPFKAWLERAEPRDSKAARR